jgi:hypothetical protein
MPDYHDDPTIFFNGHGESLSCPTVTTLNTNGQLKDDGSPSFPADATLNTNGQLKDDESPSFPADTTLITNEQSKHDSASPSNIEDGVASEESPHSNVCEESHAEEAAESNSPSTCDTELTKGTPPPADEISKNSTPQYSPLIGIRLADYYPDAADAMKSDTCEDSSPPSAKRMTSSTHADLVQTLRESRVTRSHSAPLVKEVPTAASEWGRGQKPEHPHNGRSIKDNLRTCIAALDTSNDTFTLPLGGGSRSTLQQNFVALSTFLREAIKSGGARGGESGEPATLYLCGAPGVGKTLSVTRAIAETRKWAAEQAEVAPISCIVNANSLSSQQLYDTMADALSLGKRRCTQKDLIKVLSASQSGKRSFKWSCLVVVVDEVDLLLLERRASSEKPSRGSEKALKTLMDWSMDENFHLALIGVLNSVGNENFKILQQLGPVRSHRPLVNTQILNC